MSNKIQIKRGVFANLPVLSTGEPALTTDTNQIFVGNGGTNVELSKISDLNAHKTGVMFESLTGSKDLTVEGIQTFTLANAKTPKRIEIWAVGGTPSTMVSDGSWSESGGVPQFNKFTWGGASSTNWATSNDLVYMSASAITNVTKAVFHNRWAGGFDINWSKVGTGATGTATLLVKVWYHE